MPDTVSTKLMILFLLNKIFTFKYNIIKYNMLLGFFDNSLGPKSSRFNLFTDHILGNMFLRDKISDRTAYFLPFLFITEERDLKSKRIPQIVLNTEVVPLINWLH